MGAWYQTFWGGLRKSSDDAQTIDEALVAKADFVRLVIPPSNVNVVSSYEVTGTLTYDGNPLTTPSILLNQGTNLWGNFTDGLSISSGFWLLQIDDGSWLSDQDTLTAPENCTWTPQGSTDGTPVLTFSPAIAKTPGQFALVDNNTDDPVLWENLGTDVSPDWKVSSGKADFVRLTANPGTSTSVSYYGVSGGDLAYDGTPVANGPPYLNFVSANLWQTDNLNEVGGTSSLQINNGYWQLSYGNSPAGTWISNQTSATRPEDCTWSGDGDTSGTPILTFFPQTIRALGQFALVDDGTNPSVMWQNLGNDVTPEWVALAKSSDLLSYAPLNSPALTGTPTAPTQAAGNSTTRLATTAFVATSFAPLASPALTGNPTAPTQASGNDSTRIATTAFVAAGFVPRITSVDNRLTRFDGTTGAVQSSGITVDDSNNVSGVAGLSLSGLLAVPSGSATAPTLAFPSATAGQVTGFFHAGNNVIGVTQQTNHNFSFFTTGFGMVNSFNLFWLSNVSAGTATTTLSQSSAGVLQIGTAINNALGSIALANITASGTIETTSTENASSSLNGALRVAGGMSAQMNIQSGGTIRGRDLRSWQPSGGTIGWNNGPILFNDNGTVRLRNEADTEFRHLSLGNLTASGTVSVGTYTVATLPSASANSGAFAQVTDSNSTTNGNTVAGGGSNRVPVFSNGTNWIIK